VSISKTHAPRVVEAGGILKYVLVLKNSQKIGNITDVGVQVQLPGGITYLSSKVSGFKPALATPEVVLAADILSYVAEPAKSQRAGNVTDVDVTGRSKNDKMPDLNARARWARATAS
jgi:uncharacterized repeat protein (TIGR01451 family)